MADYKIDKKRIVFNAEYNYSIDFFQKQYAIMKELSSDSPNYHISGVEFTVENKELHFSKNFNHRMCAFEFDDINSKMPEVKEAIINGLDVYNKHIAVESFISMALRMIMFVPLKEMKTKELADIIYSKLYIRNAETLGFTSENIDDLSYIINFSRGEYLYFLRSGPMPKKQIINFVHFGDPNKRFNSQEDFVKYMAEFPEMSLFIELECSQKAVPFAEKNTFINEAMGSCSEVASKLNKYLLG
jgi:hypothetical protein